MTRWLLLRGWAREARHWGTFPALLAASLPEGDTVEAADLPGCGRLCGDESPATIDGFVDALRARHGAGPFGLVAISMGAMVAMQWAHRHPDEVEACVLMNTSARGLAPWWWRLRPQAWGGLAAAAAAGGARRERAILRITSRRHAEDEALARHWAQWAREAPCEGRNAWRQLVAAARFGVPAKPVVPLLLLSSASDALVHPGCSVRLAHDWQEPLHVHPDAGHDLPLDAPHWVVARIAQWRGLGPVINPPRD